VADDLTVLNGVGPARAARLTALGFGSFAALASLSHADRSAVNRACGGQVPIGVLICQAQGRMLANKRNLRVLAYQDLNADEKNTYAWLNVRTRDRKHRGRDLKIDEDWDRARDVDRNIETAGATYLVYGARALWRTFQSVGWLPGADDFDARQRFADHIAGSLYRRELALVDYDTYPAIQWRPPIVLDGLSTALLRARDPDSLAFKGSFFWDAGWDDDLITIKDQLLHYAAYRERLGQEHPMLHQARLAARRAKRRARAEASRTPPE
jgi:hypothetical protein